MIESNNPVIDYSQCYKAIEQTSLAPLLETIPQLVDEALEPARHGDVPKWLQVLLKLPPITPSIIDLTQDALKIGCDEDITAEQRAELKELLFKFQPWRKGPFSLFDIEIDTEWHSDWKWNRLADAITPLEGRKILDVGSGNGYYGWRMLGAGADLVIGIDPTLRYLMQYAAVNHFIGENRNYVLPLRLEQIPQPLPHFDSVFSMGVIYHQRDHIGHLKLLKKHLRPGGELVLEGLVIEGGPGDCLHPPKRYAKMHNVHAVPSCDTMASWLAEAGFKNIKLIDCSPTTTEEQRRTEWMVFESLGDYLDPNDPTLTIEGHPAPLRATFTAEKL
ncbi:MAG: tRNA 5-methoxyuridine(34)/uridine 5-oxyacetic acid(34) synthase CmoB [Gammaproteobacteria bacterium]|nr:tRNA 5-methoxyuridine(34)/uridine 5-oxyacetic acid(34) synthase CmoB [Gammaproteobacteria bacterium]